MTRTTVLFLMAFVAGYLALPASGAINGSRPLIADPSAHGRMCRVPGPHHTWVYRRCRYHDGYYMKDYA